MQEMQILSLGREDPQEKEMATHYIILAWEIPWITWWATVHGTGCDLATKRNSTIQMRMTAIFWWGAQLVFCFAV